MELKDLPKEHQVQLIKLCSKDNMQKLVCGHCGKDFLECPDVLHIGGRVECKICKKQKIGDINQEQKRY